MGSGREKPHTLEWGAWDNWKEEQKRKDRIGQTLMMLADTLLLIKKDDDIFTFSTKRSLQQKRALNKLAQIEKSYDDEDTEMLIELIKIRHHLCGHKL